MAGDVGRDGTAFATRIGLGVAICRGLATSLGATTVTLGSWVATPLAVCDTALPPRLDSNAADKMMIAAGATKLEDNLMIVPPKLRRTCRRLGPLQYHRFWTSAAFSADLSEHAADDRFWPVTDTAAARSDVRDQAAADMPLTSLQGVLLPIAAYTGLAQVKVSVPMEPV